MTAAKNNDSKRVTDILSSGDAVNYLNSAGGYTALMIAAKYGRAEAINALLAGGADADLTIIGNGDTALTYAARNDRAKAIEALLAGGADVDFSPSDSGETALMIATTLGHLTSITALLKGGADVNAVNVDDETALIFAARFRNTEAIGALLDAGANVNSVNLDGETALVTAAKADSEEIVNTLITHTALFQREVFLGDNADGMRRQLVYTKYKSKMAMNFLSRETTILLATVLPEGELINSIFTNFNKRNATNPLDENDRNKITELRALRSSLEEKFLQSVNSTAASSSSSASENTESRNRNKAAILANIAVEHLVTHPSQLTDLKNYLELANVEGISDTLKDFRVSDKLKDIIRATKEVALKLAYNPRLNDSQNLIVCQELQNLITTSPRSDGISSNSSSASSAESPPNTTAVTFETTQIAPPSCDHSTTKR